MESKSSEIFFKRNRYNNLFRIIFEYLSVYEKIEFANLNKMFFNIVHNDKDLLNVSYQPNISVLFV